MTQITKKGGNSYILYKETKRTLSMINKFINHSINFEEKLNDIEYEKLKIL